MTPRPCHGPQCKEALETAAKPFCHECWEKLPFPLQQALWRAWRKVRTGHTGGAAYSEALTKAKKYLQGAHEWTREEVRS